MPHKSCHIKIARVNGLYKVETVCEEISSRFRYSLGVKGGNLSKRSKDHFSTGLIPDDLDYKYFASKPVALTVTGDGNCLSNSASLLLCGEELRNGCLRLLIAKELQYRANVS